MTMINFPRFFFLKPYNYDLQAEERHESTEERMIQLETNLQDKDLELQRVCRKHISLYFKQGRVDHNRFTSLSSKIEYHLN